MNDCLFTFRSITRAQRGQELLERIGIRCRLRRTAAALAEQGCGYVLEVPAAQGRAALEALRQNEIPFQRAYVREGGGYREWVL